MNRALRKLAIFGLLLTILPPIFLFSGALGSLATVHHLMMTGMLLWFAATIPWLAVQKNNPPE